MATRLYLVPFDDHAETVVDVPEGDLVLYGDKFVDPLVAPAVTLEQVNVSATFHPFLDGALPIDTTVAVRWQVSVYDREDIIIPTEDPPITTTDPTGGVCVCLVTCRGNRISYVVVYPASPLLQLL